MNKAPGVRETIHHPLIVAPQTREPQIQRSGDNTSIVLADSSSGLAWPSQFLRERIDSAPETRRQISERGIENEAAMDLFSIVSAITSLFPLGKVVLDSLRQDYNDKMRNLDEVAGIIDTLWGRDLVSDVIRFQGGYESKSCSYIGYSSQAIDTIKKSTIRDPQEVTFKIERAYRDLWTFTADDIGRVVANREENKPIQLAAVGLLGILDGLYHRDDIGTCSLRTTKKSYHGWQYNRKNKRTIGKNLGEESSWYGHSDAIKLFQKIVADTANSMHTDTGNNIVFNGVFGTDKLRDLERSTGNVGIDREVRLLHFKVLVRTVKAAKERGIPVKDLSAEEYKRLNK